MNSTIDRIKLIFLGLFVIACAAIWGYQTIYVWPKQRCEAQGDWWDDEDRECAVPVPIWTFTHRRPGEVAPVASRAVAAKPAASRPKAAQVAAKR